MSRLRAKHFKEFLHLQGATAVRVIRHNPCQCDCARVVCVVCVPFAFRPPRHEEIKITLRQARRCGQSIDHLTDTDTFQKHLLLGCMTCHSVDVDDARTFSSRVDRRDPSKNCTSHIEGAWPPSPAASNVMKGVSKGESSGTFWSQADTATLKTIS